MFVHCLSCGVLVHFLGGRILGGRGRVGWCWICRLGSCGRLGGLGILHYPRKSRRGHGRGLGWWIFGVVVIGCLWRIVVFVFCIAVVVLFAVAVLVVIAFAMVVVVMAQHEE